MFDKFDCNLERKALEEFIFIMTYENIKIIEEKLELALIDIYKHIINCEIHNKVFVDYINNVIKADINPHNLTENIRYLTKFIKKDDLLSTN